MQDSRPVAAAVPASHALRITAAAFETLYNVRLVTGAALVLLSSLVSLLGFSAFERLRHTFMAKAAELGVFFLVPTGLPNSADKGAELVTMAEPGFIWNLICTALAVVASTALWHAAVRANSGLLTQRASLITAAFGCLNPRQVLLLAADLSMNISIIFMALYLGGSLQLKPHECMTPELEVSEQLGQFSSAHAADAELWEGIAEAQPEISPVESTQLGDSDVTGCFVLPDVIIPALVACGVVSMVSWVSMLSGGHRAHGQFTHRWNVMGRLTESLLDLQAQAQENEEEHWQSVSSPAKQKEESNSILNDTVDNLLDVSAMAAPHAAAARTPSRAQAAGVPALQHSSVSAASNAPLMAPPRLLPGSVLQPQVPSGFVGLLRRLLGAPVDLLKASVDESLVATAAGACLLLTAAHPMVQSVQWLVDTAPAVLPVQQWQLRVAPASPAGLGGHDLLSIGAVLHLGSSIGTLAVLVALLTIMSVLRRVLLALRLSSPWGIDTILFGMPLVLEKAQVNWGAKPITKPVATAQEDPLSPVGEQPPGAFSPAALGMDAGQVDGFSVRFAAASAAPAGTLAAYLTGWSARGVRATLQADGLWRPSKGRQAPGAAPTPHSTSFRATASGLLPAGADAAAAECVLAWSHRMRDGQLALYAGAVWAVAAPATQPAVGGPQAGSRMRQGAVTHSLARNLPVVTPAAAAHGAAGIVSDMQAPVPILHAVRGPSGPFLPHVTAADVGSCAPAHTLARGLMWQDWGMAMERNSFDLAEVVGDTSGNRLGALVWTGTACVDGLSLALQAAAVDEEAPSAAGSKGINSIGGGMSPHAPAFAAAFVRSLAAYDPVASQAQWLVGGQAVASARAKATGLVEDMPRANSTPGRPAARGRSPVRSAAARAVTLLSPDGQLQRSGRGGKPPRTPGGMGTPAGSRLNASGLNATSRGVNGTLMNTMNASRLGGAESSEPGALAYLAVEPSAAFDYVQHTAAVPGSGISVQEGVMLCEVAPTYAADDMSLLLAPDATQAMDFTANSTMSARLTRSMTWSAVGSPSAAAQWNASEASRFSVPGELAVSESSLLLRLAAMAVQDTQPGSKYGLLGSVARLFIRSPAQERAALLWDGENARHATATLVALCSKGMKKDKSGALQRHLCVVVSSIATLYASARAYALSRACAGAEGIAAERLAVMGAARLNGSFEVTGSNPARALRRARIVIASLAYRQPLLLSILLAARSGLVQLLKAWGALLLDPAVCPLPPLPRVVLAHVHADMQHGIPMGVELAELMD